MRWNTISAGAALVIRPFTKMHLRPAILGILAAAVLPTASVQTSAMQTTAPQPGTEWSALKSCRGPSASDPLAVS